MGKGEESIIARIKRNMAASSSGRFDGIIYIKDGDKKRIRFLTEMERTEENRGPFEIMMHQQWGDNGLWPTPCMRYEGVECPFCGIMEQQDQSQKDRMKLLPYYAFTVRDLDKKEQVVFCYLAGGRSPIPAMLEVYEKFGTLLDRPYEISVRGTKQNKTWVLIPEGGAREWKQVIPPFKKAQYYEILKKAGGWKGAPPEGAGGDDDAPAKKKKADDDDE